MEDAAAYDGNTGGSAALARTQCLRARRGRRTIFIDSRPPGTNGACAGSASGSISISVSTDDIASAQRMRNADAPKPCKSDIQIGIDYFHSA
ncbi:hypothetical protein [Burkholderia multivorans]|uniref:hypothetical protein n=1 Tax=Burkholderia multivorans TaxID=87883 RepID=UPI0021BE227B|nr:hypothetical protein [Burkholderia multivorans]